MLSSSPYLASVNSQILTQAAPIFHEFNEISDWVSYYHPGIIKSITAINDHKTIPSSKNTTLSSEKHLIFENAEYIAHRLSHYDYVNIVELTEALGTTSVPFLLSLLDEGVQTSYTSISYTDAINQVATDNLATFIEETGLEHVPLSQCLAAPDHGPFNHVHSHHLDYGTTTDLFLLMDSYLGNAMQPIGVLRNIYSSMKEGDHLALSQGIYRSGSEQQSVEDYRYLLQQDNAFASLKEITQSIDETGHSGVSWEQSDDFIGIKFGFTPHKPTEFAGIQIAEGKEFTYFRSQRFEESVLKHMLEYVGFRIIEVSYGKNMDTALFFLQK